MVADRLNSYIPHSFFKEYQETTWFVYSSPISSLFWIFSLITRSVPVPLIDTAYLYWSLVALAISSITVPPLLYYYRNKPFHVIVSWRSVEAEPLDLRLKDKGMFRIRDDQNDGSPPPPIIVKFYFDKSVDSYKLKFGSKGPFEVTPALKPKNAEYDEENGLLECTDIEDHHFYLPIRVEEVEEDRGELERYIYIKDLTSGRNTELLRLEVH